MEPTEIGREVREARERLKWSQEELADRIGGIGQSTIDRIEKGQFKRMPSHLPAICGALGIPLPEFGTAPPAPGRLIANRIFGRRDFKVHAAAEGGPGELIVDSEPVDFIPRPGVVEHVRDAYGILITGTSMWPEFRPGQIAIVNPKMPLMSGEPYIFYAEREGEARATIKEMKRFTDKEWRVEQHNPAKQLILPRGVWRWAHMVVGRQRS